ncbi:putative transporter [Anatilimnocola sp. NA78]|uniref:putative transporter n=1 Tax=Anatilimnocola sp. NA78 TaxID=3415683 RepID=UPI003CE4C129
MLDWIFEISQTSPVGHTIGLLTLVCALGMALGSIKFKGIRLGSAGVLFVGILVASVSDPINKPTLDFVKEFGLVLFVFTIGLQLGPGFFASLRSDGVQLNLLAAALVITAGVMTPLLGWLCGIERHAFAGLFAGASTNSPALGAAQQSFASLPNASPEQLAIPALACAVTYPIAIAGLLGVLILIKVIFRIDPELEAREFATARSKTSAPLLRWTLILENSEFVGLTLREIYRRTGDGVVVSRVRHADDAVVAAALRTTQLQLGDVVLAVGPETLLATFQAQFGPMSEEDLLLAPGNITYRKIIVTDKRALGQTAEELGLESKFGVELTRITRGDSEMTAVPGLRLQFGDVVQVVGTEEQLKHVAAHLGNSLKKLNETQFIPLFAGIFLGVIVGSIPFALPGLAVPLRIGLAGGPLIVALCLGRLGHVGGVVWHMPQNANHAFREFGVALFFAALGLAAGDQFFAAVFSPRGMVWAAVGFAITVTPLLAVSIWARAINKMNYVTLGGMLSGAMTNPPALTFVSSLCKSESPTLAYATVYPLATLLRILVAQVLALTFCS